MQKGSAISKGCERAPEDRKPTFPEVEVRPRSWLEPVVLASLRARSSYGYEMMEHLTEFGFETTNPGTIYRTLRRMEKNGQVESRWETSEGGPARRRYTITDAGEADLVLWVEALKQCQRSMDTFSNLYTGRPPRPDKENEGR